MANNKKITEKEWKKHVDPQLEAKGFNRHEREALHGAFYSDLNDIDFGEHQPLFGRSEKGITEEEAKDGFEQLRNPYSPVSKSLKTKLHPAKLDVAEEVFKEALDGNKGGW